MPYEWKGQKINGIFLEKIKHNLYSELCRFA